MVPPHPDVASERDGDTLARSADVPVPQLSADSRSGAHPRIHFPGCAEPSLGVELEVSLIDPQSRNLAPLAPQVLALLDDPQHAKAEVFRTIVELNTRVCQSVGQVRTDLSARMAALQRVCGELKIGALCTGSHPIADWRHVPISADPRYAALLEHMAWPARRLLICGMHVHVGVKSGEHAVALMNALSVFLPHFLALSASSPYWHGIDTGMASCRAKVFEGLPTAGLPPAVRNWGEFVSLMQTLLTAGSIRSIREIWWDCRPHPAFGTLELRICDGVNSLQEICALTALVQCLVVYMQDLYDHGTPLPHLRAWTLAENKWRAARYGLQAQLIRNEHGAQLPLAEHLRSWLVRLAPVAQRLGCSDELQEVHGMVARGASSSRQRAWYEQHGSLETVVDQLLREFADHAHGGAART